ncbi:VOC family protein [Virgibacillus sp. W0181]|uniref:VOC family protein n=1 Tax=Virgibacillus sp. W0181 TaxID=3391581 RepID=UPI003F46EC0D
MLALDHIVIGGTDAAKASAEYSNIYTVKAVRGGDHENWGTYNYLAYFSNNSYLEWLDISDDQTAKESTNPLIRHLVYQVESNQSGPFQFALRTNDINKYINHFNMENIPYEGPFFGRRARPNGSSITWKMLFPSYDHTKEILPFLIEWDQPIHERVDPSIVNAQAIEKVSFGAYDRMKFAHIYRVKFKKMYKSSMPLRNTKFNFKDKNDLGFTLV